MATCKYCGQSSGFFSSSHKECEEKKNAFIYYMEYGVGKFRKKKINTGNSSVSVKTMKFRKWYGDFLFAKSAA